MFLEIIPLSFLSSYQCRNAIAYGNPFPSTQPFILFDHCLTDLSKMSQDGKKLKQQNTSTEGKPKIR